MADIKTKDMKPKTVNTIDKAIAWTERVKDPAVYANEKVKDASELFVQALKTNIIRMHNVNTVFFISSLIFISLIITRM